MAPHFGEAIPYYLTLTQSWFYILMGTSALIYQFGLMPSVAWSVSTEWFFYLIYPFICFSIIKMHSIRSKVLAFILIGFMTLICIAVISLMRTPINDFAVRLFGTLADVNVHSQDSFFRWLIYFSPYSRISEFLVGCITASMFIQIAHHIPSQREERIGLFVLICSIVSTIIFHYLIFNPPIASLSWIINLHQCFGFAPSMAVIIFCCARYNNVISRFISNPTMLLGGEISYSMYLLHLPIGEAFSRDAANITSWDVALADCTRLMIAFAAIFGAAIVSYRVVEVPSRRLLRRWLMIRNRQLIIEPQPS